MAYGFPIEPVASRMTFYKNMKARVRPPDNTNIFIIFARVLQGDIFAPYWFIVCQNYVKRMSIELMKKNGFALYRKGADNIKQKLLQTQMI